MEVQAPTSTTVGYLPILDAKTIDYKELTSLVQESKYFTKLLIKIRTQELRLTKDQKKLDKNDTNRLEVVTILRVGHFVKTTIKACKKIFNSTGSRVIYYRPGGTSAKFFTWYAYRDLPNPDKDQKRHARIEMYKQKHWSK